MSEGENSESPKVRLAMDQLMCCILLGVVLTLIQCTLSHVEEKGCSLYDTYIHCKGSQNVVLPSGDTSKVESIFFTSCNMSLLTPEDFAPFPQVINIEIRSSNLSFPTNNELFRKLKDLNDLRVENCDVGEEVVKLLTGNEPLERLSLPKNRIKSISRRLLSNFRELQELDLSGNGATHLEDGAFDELKELRILDLSDNAIQGGSARVVALTPDRCSVCRLPGVSVGCSKRDVTQCAAGRPLDRLWWRSSGLALRLEGNPVCNESSTSVGTESLEELYYGDIECVAEEEECSKQESRKLFLREACGKRHPNASESTAERRYLIEAGFETVAFYTVGVIICGIVIGGVSVYYISSCKQKKSAKNSDSSDPELGGGTSERNSDEDLKPRIVPFATSQDMSKTVQYDAESCRLLDADDTRRNSIPNEGETVNRQLLRLPSVADSDKNYDTIGSSVLQTSSPISDECLNPCDCNSHEGSPLHIAALEGDLEKLNKLLEEGEDPAKKTCRKESALWFAILGGHQKVVEILYQKSPEEVQSCNQNGDTPLHIAVHEENETIVNLLLEYNASRSVQNKKGETPLHIAVYRRNIQFIKLLLDGSDCINVPNIQGNTPLFLAVRLGPVKIVHLLLEKGAELNIENVRKEKPIHIACWHGKGKIVQILIDKGSKLNVKDRYGNTELHVACRRGHLNIAKALLRSGSEINAANRKGNTPLHRAVKGNHYKLVELLIEEGADISVKNDEGQTALDKAISLSNKKSVIVFLNKRESKSVENIASADCCNASKNKNMSSTI